eukprot:TRINITY_DN4087_c0_g1_i1.p3 TRINITY_DN4087_c0_g1~~TRINITY_DN4087_c0_g1_i1.p3  ORF type:complete len:53 (-),score=3.27 TRINITY_DN4087_c0_g1_i1:352-510(-)
MKLEAFAIIMIHVTVHWFRWGFLSARMRKSGNSCLSAKLQIHIIDLIFVVSV